MKKIFLLILLGISVACNPNPRPDGTNVPGNENTYVLITGVLEWQQGLSPFEKKNRKDQELHDLFLKQGVPEDRMLLLLDGEATLDNIQKGLKALAEKSDAGSTLIFYYAGHGMKSQDGKTYFANYDIDPANPAKTGLDVSMITSVINEHFNGSTVWLTADCCYSGALLDEGAKLSGMKVLVSTSATAANTSTANWTFTQTMIDCLSGLALADHNSDGNITAGEWRTELSDAMKYREQQKCGFMLSGLADDFVIAAASGERTLTTDPDHPVGSYVIVQNGREREIARITGMEDKQFRCEFYHYSDKSSQSFGKNEISPLHFVQYPVGSELEVEWDGAYYKAKVIKADGDFHYITYPGYKSYWDEWVMSNRIKNINAKSARVEWDGQWYPATVLEEKDGKYFIHYTGYGSEWDEWVGDERIKF